LTMIYNVEVNREVIMVDTCLFPTGALGGWEIALKQGSTKIGFLKQEGREFSIVADADSILDGVSSGPYSSRGDAMSAIEVQTGGTCELYSG
jgi:hypothetical protein